MGLDGYDAISSRADVDASRILMFGFSMGTGVANYVASNRPASGLILFAPYADGYDLYNSMVPIFYGPMRALVAFRMESIRFANIRSRPLVFSSVDDRVVPFASSERLSQAYPSGCEFVQMQGLGHNDYWGSDDVLERVSQYIAEVPLNSAPAISTWSPAVKRVACVFASTVCCMMFTSSRHRSPWPWSVASRAWAG